MPRIVDRRSRHRARDPSRPVGAWRCRGKWGREFGSGAVCGSRLTGGGRAGARSCRPWPACGCPGGKGRRSGGRGVSVRDCARAAILGSVLGCEEPPASQSNCTVDRRRDAGNVEGVSRPESLRSIARARTAREKMVGVAGVEPATLSLSTSPGRAPEAVQTSVVARIATIRAGASGNATARTSPFVA